MVVPSAEDSRAQITREKGAPPARGEFRARVSSRGGSREVRLYGLCH